MLAAGLLFAVTAALIKLVAAHLPNEMWCSPQCHRAGRARTVAAAARTEVFRDPSLGAHLVRALTGLAAMYCYFYAIAHLPLAEAVLLNYSAPLFIPLAALLWVGEPFSAGCGGRSASALSASR